MLGDTKKISTRLQSGRYLADDALRPPVLITYDMQGNLARTEDYLDGCYAAAASDVASDSDNNWTDAAMVDAHVYLGYTYDYYFKRFGRQGPRRPQRADLRHHPPGAAQRFPHPLG